MRSLISLFRRTSEQPVPSCAPTVETLEIRRLLSHGGIVAGLLDDLLEVMRAKFGATDSLGLGVGGTSVVGKYTYFGDGIGGRITGEDYGPIDANLGKSSIKWVEGDYNMDGVISGEDYGYVDGNLGTGADNPLAFEELKAEMIRLHEEYSGEQYVKVLRELEGAQPAAVTGPRVISTIPDNRGEVLIRLDDVLDPVTVNRRSVMMHLAGDDNTIGTDDDEKIRIRVGYNASTRTITLRPYNPIPANTPYRVKLDSKIVKNINGTPLDGEFNGPGAVSGNGEQRGDYVFLAGRNFKVNTARFTTHDFGAFEVNLFRDLTPLTVANFYNYADAGDWDGTIFHRLVPDFVVQGGGFRVVNNEIDDIPADSPVQNEPGVPNNIGRMSMAKIGGDPNSATNQWFINLANNTDLNTQNGGFTAFGEVANDASWNVVKAIASLDRINAGGAFSELPVKDDEVVQQRGALDPQEDVVIIRRVAMIMRMAALPTT